MAPAATAPRSWSEEAAPVTGVDEAGAATATVVVTEVSVADSTTRGVLEALTSGVEELGVTLKVELE